MPKNQPLYIQAVTFLLIALLCVPNIAYAQTEADSLIKIKSLHPKWYDTHMMKGVYTGAPLIGLSLALKGVKKDYRAIRTNMGSIHKVEWEDYTQYAPLAACYLMKVSGVKSRSAWGRMLVSHAISAGAVTGLVNGMKYPIGERRPDGTSRNSYPSGHTATAFMAATLLHREYGHVSPWISVGGYAVATATGIGRVINNRHWATDVLAGAGIGIISGEFGYFIGDLIFRDKYVRKTPKEENYDVDHRPSYLSINVGAAFPLTHVTSLQTTPEGPVLQHYKLNAGSDAAVEGAYFFTSHWGIGGGVHLTSSAISALEDGEYHTTNYNLALYSTTLHALYSHPFSEVVRLQGKFAVGYNYSSINEDPYRTSDKNALHTALHEGASSLPLGGNRKSGVSDWSVNDGGKGCEVGSGLGSYLIGTGLSVHFTPTRRLDASLYGQWNMAGRTALGGSKDRMHILQCGASAAIRF